jgi:hypothetical protein
MPTEVNQPKRYLAVIQFAPSTSVAELGKRVPGIRNHIARISHDETEQFFRTPEGNTFGMFFKTAKPLAMLRAELDNATNNADAFMLIEVGTEALAKGFGRAITWLQHH